MKASVDESVCIACEQCVDMCPEVFQMIGETSFVKVDPIPPDQENCTRAAAEDCPVEAILIEE